MLIAVLVVTLLALAGFWGLRVSRSEEQLCVHPMRNLQSAAVSYCLENKRGPDSMVGVDALVMYANPGLTVCLGGGPSYPLSVLQGPSCRNGHLYEPGVARPLRATYLKTAGLYLQFGLTHVSNPAADAAAWRTHCRPRRFIVPDLRDPLDRSEDQFRAYFPVSPREASGARWRQGELVTPWRKTDRC